MKRINFFFEKKKSNVQTYIISARARAFLIFNGKVTNFRAFTFKNIFVDGYDYQNITPICNGLYIYGKFSSSTVTREFTIYTSTAQL